VLLLKEKSETAINHGQSTHGAHRNQPPSLSLRKASSNEIGASSEETGQKKDSQELHQTKAGKSELVEEDYEQRWLLFGRRRQRGR